MILETLYESQRICYSCGSTKSTNNHWYLNHDIDNNMLCMRCHMWFYRQTHKEQCSIYRKEYYQKNNEYLKQHMKNKARSFRIKIISQLGGKCVRCGFSDIRALQLDHINGGGGKHMKDFNGDVDKMYRYYYKNIDSARSIFQVLCSNCNWIKRYENEEDRRS